MTLIQFRRGNAAAWTDADPVLAVGELGYEADTGKWKIGNGSTHWVSLPYATAEATWASITGKPAVIAAGATQADARAAIGAGTSSLALGTTSNTAKAGNYAPTSGEIVSALGFTPANAAIVGQANGIATLDGAGKIPTTMLTVAAVEYRGTWNASTNTPTLADGTGSTGDLYRVSVAGTRNLGSGAIQFRVGDSVIYNGSVWERSATGENVASVAGLQGDVTSGALKTALSLDAVDNTSDANKPVSTATATALSGKEPTITAGTTSQWWRGDKSWQSIGKADVGLGNVENTSDASKPVSTATATALSAKVDVGGALGTPSSGNLVNCSFPTLNQNTTGNAATATRLAQSRTINGLASFDGSANVVTHNTGWMPVDYSWLAWAYDPIAATANQATTGGTLYISSIKVPAATTISNIILAVSTNGTSLTANQNLIALYQGGNLLATSADQSSVWAIPGIKVAAITPQSVSAGTIQIAVLTNASGTTPSLAGRTAPGARDILNLGLSGLGLRFATAGTGLTSMPSTLGTLTASTISLWVAVA